MIGSILHVKDFRISKLYRHGGEKQTIIIESSACIKKE